MERKGTDACIVAQYVRDASVLSCESHLVDSCILHDSWFPGSAGSKLWTYAEYRQNMSVLGFNPAVVSCPYHLDLLFDATTTVFSPVRFVEQYALGMTAAGHIFLIVWWMKPHAYCSKCAMLLWWEFLTSRTIHCTPFLRQ